MIVCFSSGGCFKGFMRIPDQIPDQGSISVFLGFRVLGVRVQSLRLRYFGTQNISGTCFDFETPFEMLLLIPIYMHIYYMSIYIYTCLYIHIYI